VDAGIVLGIGKAGLVSLYAATALVGLVHCFLGLRIFRVALGILGFAVGATVGAKIGIEAGGGGRAAWLVGTLAGGAVGATLLVYLWKAGVFVLGAGFGAAVLTGVYRSVSGEKPEPVLLVAAGALGGTIALLLKKPLIVLGTAFGGAFAAAIGVAAITGHYDPGPLYTALRQGFREVYEHDTLLDLFSVFPAYLWAALAAGAAGTVVQAVLALRPGVRS
jgi:hypothetical protein